MKTFYHIFENPKINEIHTWHGINVNMEQVNTRTFLIFIQSFQEKALIWFICLCSGGPLTVQDAPYNTPIGIGFLQAAQEFGYDLVDVNGEQQTGFAFYQFNMRRGSRCSAAKAFLRPVRLRKNLHVALFAHATRILVNAQTKRAFGVEFYRDGAKRVVYARREVILTAGAIGSPHILLNSGIGPRSDLESVGVPVIHDLEGVGRNLQDHIAIGGLGWTINQPVGIKTNRLINLPAALRYAISENGPLTSSIGLEAVGFLNTKYANQSDDWPDMNFMLTSASLFADQQAKIAHGLKKKYFDECFGDLVTQDTISILPMILRPKSRGFIKLHSRNPLRYPLLYHNYLTHPDDVNVMREGVKLAIAYGETDSLKRQFGAKFHHRPVPNCKHLPMFTDEYWNCFIRQYTMTIYHMSGTAKMGPATDPEAVVDPQLRVYGINGLRVIDASIMPAITNGNIYAPVIMIAEKGADMVKAFWLRDEIFRYRRNDNWLRSNRTANQTDSNNFR